MTCHRYDKCVFTQKKIYYDKEESEAYYNSCLNKGEGCSASKLSDIEFKVLEKEKGENIWKES